MEYKAFTELPEEAIEIRTEVFMKEQGFQDEFDDIDQKAKHIVVYKDGKAAGTGRVYLGNEPDTYVLGRIAVSKELRGCKAGAFIINALEKEVQKMGGRTIELSAQYNAKEFYEKQGYHCVGEIYLDEHCEHIKMIKKL